MAHYHQNIEHFIVNTSDATHYLVCITFFQYFYQKEKYKNLTIKAYAKTMLPVVHLFLA